MKGLFRNSKFRKAFVLLALALVLLNVVFVTISIGKLFRSIASYHSVKFSSFCPKMTIHPELNSELLYEKTACVPQAPGEDACKYTAKIFAPYPSLAKCKDQLELPYELCTISETKSHNDAFTMLTVKCNLSLCDRTEEMYIEVLNPSDGKMIKYEIPKGANDTTIEKLVYHYASAAREKDLNFLFLSCSGQYHHGKVISQMLTLLPPLPVLKDEASIDKVNVNVVLLDSVSRAHFYRSLPNTIKYLREKQAESNYGAHIFDFELFQAVHGHTHENEHALFSGSLFPDNFTSKQKSSAPVNLEVLFGVFKRAGYQTMFLDDLCWQGTYGIVTKLKSRGWKGLVEKMKLSNIDTRGITEAACKILRTNKKTIPFFDNKEHQLCFNGKHHHQYILEYLIRYIESIGDTPKSKPFFSYTSTHVSHDEIGVRVQTLDKDLKNFIDIMSTRQDTITIIFADHGNTYTYYQVKMPEGRQEMYHPAMLAILPKQLGKKFGEQVILNLKTNQHRLLNLFDLRAGLVELAKYDGKSILNPAGIFGRISEKRTCSDLALTKGIICICERWNIAAVTNSTAQFAIAEFAIGQLNNRIQESLLKSRKKDNLIIQLPILFGACQRLRIQSISNVRQLPMTRGVVRTGMDIKVQSGTAVDQEELITIQVESLEKGNSASLKMNLVSFNRISKYGPHKKCADPGVLSSLCVCNKEATLRNRNSIHDIIGNNSKIKKLSRCLLEIRREFAGNSRMSGASVYEIANICSDRKFKVTFNSVRIKNVRTSADLPLFLTLQPRTIYFVVSSNKETRLSLRLNVQDETEEDE